MSEVTFAKSFLATLDKRPIKLPGDHVSDPRKLPGTSPYVLPKQTHPFPRRGPAETAQAKSKNITVSLKPMRSGETIKLSDIPLDTSVHDIKTQYAAKAGGLTLDKIKILLNKKPAADLKTLNDLGVTGDVELGVMLMGGAGASQAASPAAVASDPVVEKVAPTDVRRPADEMEIDTQTSAPESEKAQAMAEQQATDETDTVAQTLGTDEFWNDLRDFLAQRLRHQKEGERLAQVFRAAAGK